MYRVLNNVRVWGDLQNGSLEQIVEVLRRPHVIEAVLMGDNHMGVHNGAPVGSVIALDANYVAPSLVGVDIGCGVIVARLNVKLEQLGNLHRLGKHLYQDVLSFGMGVGNKLGADAPFFHERELWYNPLVADLKFKAAGQFGSIGGSNHFVNLMYDEDRNVYIMAHFGSRGFGNKIARGYMNLANGLGWDDGGENPEKEALDIRTPLGADYWDAMQLAGIYAREGREWVVSEVARQIGAEIVDVVQNHHNFAWMEEHFGLPFNVVRKGATPLTIGQRSIVGGSMADISAIISGIDNEEYLASMRATMHGSGRIMSRTAAAGQVNYKSKHRERMGGSITRTMMEEMNAEYGVIVFGGGTDESGFVYRKLQTVLDAHAGYVKVETYLRPAVVFMAPEGVKSDD